LLSLSILPSSPHRRISSLSLHDALPIYCPPIVRAIVHEATCRDRHLTAAEVGDRATKGSSSVTAEVTSRHRHTAAEVVVDRPAPDRKSTRLNSSHVKISYAVFCLKKKNK